jgi:hypothetical protein
LLNIGHTLIITAVILYYSVQMHYVWWGDMSMLQSGGRLNKHLNFELVELSNSLSYDNLPSARGAMYASTS